MKKVVSILALVVSIGLLDSSGAPSSAQPPLLTRSLEINGEDICFIFHRNQEGSWSAQVKMKVDHGDDRYTIVPNMIIRPGMLSYDHRDLAMALEEQCQLY